MKKYAAFLLAIVCVLMTACGKSESATPPNTEAVVLDSETAQTSEETEASRIAESYPVVALDNEYVKITVDGKFENADQFKKFGYNILIENKSDQYIMVVPVNCSVDGVMLPLSETPFIDVHTITPNMKAQTYLFYMVPDNNKTVKTVEDLVNFDGQWQISFSSDGSTFKDTQNYNFDYILP